MSNALLLMCSEMRLPALWACWSPRKAPPLCFLCPPFLTQWMRGPLPITDHHSGRSDPAEQSLLLLVAISTEDPAPSDLFVPQNMWTWIRFIGFNKAREFGEVPAELENLQLWLTIRKEPRQPLCRPTPLHQGLNGWGDGWGFARWRNTPLTALSCFTVELLTRSKATRVTSTSVSLITCSLTSLPVKCRIYR